MKIVFRWLPGCFRGTWVYIGGRSRSVAARGAHEIAGVPCRGGRTLHPRGRLGCFLACTPSPLYHVCSKSHASEGFIPFAVWTLFDIPFLRNTEIGKKTAIRAGPPVSKLVPKMI